MSGAHQHLEHAEHAAHGGGHRGSTTKYIGVTMALIGALIAFCAAMVGSERNELTRTMIEQTQSHAGYTAASTKFRSVMLELEKQRGKLAVLNASGGSPGGASMDLKVVTRFVQLASDYSSERAVTKKWADSYKPLVDAHFEGAEGYERAQLIAEFGIVLASLAVLLGSRPVWLVSVVFAVWCIGQLVWVSAHTKRIVQANIGFVQEAEKAYEEVRHAHGAAGQDEETIEQLDPGGKIRRSIGEGSAEKEKAHQPDAAEGGQHK